MYGAFDIVWFKAVIASKTIVRYGSLHGVTQHNNNSRGWYQAADGYCRLVALHI